MFKTLLSDKKYIEGKYHDPSKPFDAYNRFAYRGWKGDVSTGLSDADIKARLAVIAAENAGKPHAAAKAAAVKFILENGIIDVDGHDYFPYFYNWGRLAGETTSAAWLGEVFAKFPEKKALRDELFDAGAVSIWPDFDHVVPDWNALLSLGFAGIRDRAAEYKKKLFESGGLDAEKAAFYDAIITEYDATIALVDRFYKLAAKKTFPKAEAIAKCLAAVRDGAPKTTYEALMVMYIYFVVTENVDSYQTRSLGNGLDSTLFSFYERDLASGRYTKDEIGEFIGYFFMQFSAIGNYWGHPTYLGGIDKDGKTKYNDLSMLILDVYDELGIYNPKFQIKIDESMPEAVLDKCCDMIRRGSNSMMLCCDKALIRAVTSYGATYEEAHDYDMRGCLETGVRANEVCTDPAHINLAKCVRYVFTRGVDERTGKALGVDTGELAALDTFEKFTGAAKKQFLSLLSKAFDVVGALEPYLSWINPSPMYSATIKTSVETGCDAYQDGCKFENTGISFAGFATAVDALAAINEFVYEKKLVTLEKFAEAIRTNWDAAPELYVAVKRSPRKYGNGDGQTDAIAADMAEFLSENINGVKNARGGIYKTLLHSAMHFVWQGEKTGATPDGRRDGEELAKNGSPCVGMDREGVTALINSMLEIKPERFTEGGCVDIMLHPTAVSGDDGLEVLKALIKTYCKLGGTSMNINVFNADTLVDAQLHPERYENLQVRVCGWNVLWNNIPKVQQDAYIERARNIAK